MTDPRLDNPDLAELLADEDAQESASLACVLSFNANDPSGAGGLSGDAVAMASVGAHCMPICTGTYVRDTSSITDFFALDDEAVHDQARAVAEDVPVQVIKVGFVGTPESLAVIAELSDDYDGVPVVAYMPNLSWWEEDKIDAYLDAFRELLLPQTSVLVGHHSTLRRWLLPDWSGERNPGPRDIAKAAAELGVPYTLVTGLPLPEQHIDNVLASPQAVLANGLRALGDVWAPLLVQLASFWALAIPLSWVLAFRLDLGTAGLMGGIAAGCLSAALLNGARFLAVSRRPLRRA